VRSLKAPADIDQTMIAVYRANPDAFAAHQYSETRRRAAAARRG